MNQRGNEDVMQCLCFPCCSFVLKALRDGLAKGDIAGHLKGELDKGLSGR